MTLEAGVRLGPYEISSRLGAGGMGEVYRARDTRLERDVAIKVLPAQFAADAQLRLRLEREAKTISSLNHPNICMLFDVGHEADHDYLVMELVEGESLADRLLRGPLPVEEVVTYGIQIAEALDRAHRQGIIHRDLKPGNIMLTKSGVKLLDFGLAKSMFDKVPPTSGTAFATEVKPLTQEGMIVGTFQYMSPEQLESAAVDARTDIFALGAVLYEMATGKRAFTGKSRTSLIAAIVSTQPAPISTISPLTPPALEHVVEQCLEKDPDARWQSARDIAEELKWISAKGSQIGVAAPVARRRRMRERLAWSLYPLIALVAIAATWGVMKLRTPAPRVVQSSILPPPKAKFDFDLGGAPAISPDGSRIVFAAQAEGGPRKLWVRPINGGSAQPLEGTDDANNPFWSPDSRMIAFFAGGKLKKIDPAGGAVQTLCDITAGRGGSWSSKGFIVYAPTLGGPLYQVADTGGVPVQVTNVDTKHGQTDDRWPTFLPDGERFLYLVEGTGINANAVWAGSIDGKLHQKVVNSDSNVALTNDGVLVYWHAGSLVAQRLDLKSLTVGRDVVPIAEGVAHNAKNEAIFSISSKGDLIYQGGAASNLSQLIWFDASGKQIGTVGKIAEGRHPSLSPDGRHVAHVVVSSQNHDDIWIEDLTRGTASRLTFDKADEFLPIWSPDGTKIIYDSDAKNPSDIMMKNASGTGADSVVYANKAFDIATDISRDGSTILFGEIADGRSDFDLWIYSVVEHKARVFLATPFSEVGAKYSPDAKWIVYGSNESGISQVYVLAASGNGGKFQISVDGGDRPRWSRDGKTIFFLSLDLKLMAVDISETGDSINAGVPRVLFQTNPDRTPGWPYDVSADGKRFLVNTMTTEGEETPMTLVQNWQAALRK